CKVEAVEHLRLFPARTFARPGPMSSGGASRHLIIGTRCRDRTVARGGATTESSDGRSCRATARDLAMWATIRDPADPGGANQVIGSKDVLARRQAGRGANRSLRPSGHGSAHRIKLRRSARAWLRRSNCWPLLGPPLARHSSPGSPRAGKEFAMLGTPPAR